MNPSQPSTAAAAAVNSPAAAPAATTPSPPAAAAAATSKSVGIACRWPRVVFQTVALAPQLVLPTPLSGLNSRFQKNYYLSRSLSLAVPLFVFKKGGTKSEKQKKRKESLTKKIFRLVLEKSCKGLRFRGG